MRETHLRHEPIRNEPGGREASGDVRRRAFDP